MLGGDDDANLPEGWGADDIPKDVDMQITFTPGLRESNATQEETTIQKYERKLKEKRRRRKEGEKKEGDGDYDTALKSGLGDEFFDDSDASHGMEAQATKESVKSMGKHAKASSLMAETTLRPESTAEELALLVTSDALDKQPKHFNLKSVIKAEKKSQRKAKKGRKEQMLADGDNEVQENFSIDVKDERFKALHEDHTFAIDPSNPQSVSHLIANF